MTSTTSPSTRRIYCNPLDLEYRYQDVRFTGVVRGLTIGEPRRSVHRAVSYTHLTLPTNREV